MTYTINMGTVGASAPATLDIAELLSTRLLVQGNSGSGKSHLLRRLLEQSAKLIQQAIIDPEGDFVSFEEAFGHVVINAIDHKIEEIVKLASTARAHRLSVVLNLEALELEAQMTVATAFLNALFNAPQDQWHPMLVVVDEAQLFAPATGEDVHPETKKASVSAMTNLMCRGRKRGLAGVLATQRLAKVKTNVTGECSNFFMGRTYLDIDQERAAELLGMRRTEAKRFAEMVKGEFFGFGPAIARTPVKMKIGTVSTGGAGGALGLAPPPSLSSTDARQLLFIDTTPPPPPPVIAQPAPAAMTPAVVAPTIPARPAMPPRRGVVVVGRRPAQASVVPAPPPVAAPAPSNILPFAAKRPAPAAVSAAPTVEELQDRKASYVPKVEPFEQTLERAKRVGWIEKPNLSAPPSEGLLSEAVTGWGRC